MTICTGFLGLKRPFDARFGLGEGSCSGLRLTGVLEGCHGFARGTPPGLRQESLMIRMGRGFRTRSQDTHL